MKPQLASQDDGGFTLIELLVIIAVFAIFLGLFDWGVPPGQKRKAQHVACISNLKQIAITYRLWENDNNNLYPMAVSVTNGGAMEPLASGNVAAGFLVMSNELSTPKILWCPADADGVPAANFSNLNNSNISYFTGLDITNETSPQRLLTGDDNFAIGGVRVKSGLLELSTSIAIDWSAGRHHAYNSHFWTPVRDRFVGNIGLADGSVQQVTTVFLQKAFQQTGQATNRLAIP
jgi:prepilin-type N-terminal cleavage/methylation domain-containing protein